MTQGRKAVVRARFPVGLIIVFCLQKQVCWLLQVVPLLDQEQGETLSRVASKRQLHLDPQQGSSSSSMMRSETETSDVKGILIDNTTATTLSGETTWLDLIVEAQYPTNRRTENFERKMLKVVYPSEFIHDPIISMQPKGDGTPEIIHAQWTPAPERFFGKHDKPLSQEQGGMAVRGEWPDTLQALTYIGILKNAHTFLLNTMGDLRQRLDSSTSTHLKSMPKILPIMNLAVKRQSEQRAVSVSHPGHAVFAIVRDPVDRFLSSSCQDMITITVTSITARQCPGFSTTSPEPLKILDCIIDQVATRKILSHHQTPQAAILMKAVQNIHVGVTLIPQDTALTALVQELGGHNEKSRDRTKEIVYKRHKAWEAFCALQPANLTASQIAAVCDIYKGDVRMMAMADIHVPLCADVSDNS